MASISGTNFPLQHLPAASAKGRAGLNPLILQQVLLTASGNCAPGSEKMLYLRQGLLRWDVKTGKPTHTLQEACEEEHVCCAFSCQHQPARARGLAPAHVMAPAKITKSTDHS